MNRSILFNRIHLLFLGLIIVTGLTAQNIDSLRLTIAELPASSDKLLAYKTQLDQNKSVNPAGFLLLARDAIELAQKTGDDQLLCKFYYDLSSCYYFLYEIDSMIVYAEKTAALATDIKDFKLSSTSHNLLGIAYKSKAEYTTALERFISSIKYAESGGDSILAGTALINMAQIYDVMNDTTATVETYKKSIGVFSRLKIR
jgi:tetratricopeptide (TPR) repeat protein